MNAAPVGAKFIVSEVHCTCGEDRLFLARSADGWWESSRSPVRRRCVRRRTRDG